MRKFTFFCITILNIEFSFAQYSFPNISLPNLNQQWRTYVDGQDVEYLIEDLTTDKLNNLISVGFIQNYTSLLHLVTPNGFQPTLFPGPYQFQTTTCITKFNSSGKKIWGTFFGKENYPSSVLVDNAGNIYISGYYNGLTPPLAQVPVTVGAHKTVEIPFPFFNGSQTILMYSGDGFIAKFSPSGNLIWSTLYGGEGSDVIHNMVIDINNNIYISGSTNSSTGIATAGSFKENYTPTTIGLGNLTGMLVKFDSSGKRIWGTYYGADNTTQTSCNKLQIDSSGNIIVAGTTNSHNEIATNGTHMQVFSTAGTLQYRPFIAKFEPRAGFRLWGTYYGPSQATNTPNSLNLCELATIGDQIFFSGFTTLDNSITTTGSFMPSLGGGIDPFMVCLNENGSRKWGSYYGSTGTDYSMENCLQVSKDRNALYFTGTTNSTTGISTINNYNVEELYGNPYLMKINRDGNKMWGSYISTYHNLQVPGLNQGSSFAALLSTPSGALYTSILHRVQGSLPIGDTSVFQNIAGGLGPIVGSNLFTKYIDTTSTTVIVTPPPTNPPPTVFEIYPNPSNGIFTIRTTSPLPYDYTVYQADGKLVQAGSTNGYYTQLNLMAKAAAMYSIKITERSTGKVFVRKLLKL